MATSPELALAQQQYQQQQQANHQALQYQLASDSTHQAYVSLQPYCSVGPMSCEENSMLEYSGRHQALQFQLASAYLHFMQLLFVKPARLHVHTHIRRSMQ